MFWLFQNLTLRCTTILTYSEYIPGSEASLNVQNIWEYLRKPGASTGMPRACLVQRLQDHLARMKTWNVTP